MCNERNLIIFEQVSISSSNRSDMILFPFDLAIKFDRILSVIGVSGSGKTTFLKLVMNLLRPESGWITEGKIKKMPGLRIGWIAQNPSLQLFKNFVFEEFYPLTRKESENCLSKFGLDYLAAKRCCELSQGEKTLIVFAVAMSRNINLLVMDEVMVNLSASRRDNLKMWLKNFVSAGGSVISVEHTTDMAEISDDIIYIDQGRVQPVSGEVARSILAVDFSGLPLQKDTTTCNSECLNISGLSDTGIVSSALNPLELSIKKGEFIGLKGDNGTGKTTLLNIIAGLIKPGRGRITCNGKKLNGLKSRLGKMSFVSHEPLNQLFAATVSDEFDFTRCAFDGGAVKLLKDFNLETLSDRGIYTLSYGEQQRLVLSVNIVSPADILLLDEPTYGMDKQNMRVLIETLLSEKKKGRTIIMASHDESLLNHLADRIISI
ncbi:MAG: putative HMP/thiamine import ATP-binding protein YkoD [Elusimicrobia bacterium ADurb.Bin231]|nr:MAG: putative HMP/thiamine import ATP-binding protein YkoD [Elusimicrobia bacterium ADurb.Bin231]